MMIAGFSPDDLKEIELFFPYAYEHTMRGIREQIRFAHYSSAESAMKMLESNEVWMRKASAMNDFREIQYGKDLLLDAYKSEVGKQLRETIDKIFPGITGEIEKLFNGWYPYFETDTYLTCVSEHDPSEDNLGRLSMWRAYGGATGVTVVLKGAPFLAPTDALKAYTSPVAYLSAAQFQREFERMARGLMDNAEFIRTRGEAATAHKMFAAFRAATICTKHPGFHEEREWRVVYSPKFEQSTRIAQSVETIRGVPQVVQKIPLVDAPEEGLVGITIPDLVDRVIIGPTNFPEEMREAFIVLMTAKGIADADQKVIISDIPLRGG